MHILLYLNFNIGRREVGNMMVIVIRSDSDQYKLINMYNLIHTSSLATIYLFLQIFTAGKLSAGFQVSKGINNKFDSK